MSGTTLGILAAVLEGAVSGVWFRLMQRVRIPADRRPFVIAHGVAVALGVAALAAGTGVLGTICATVAILGGLVFLALQLQSGQARLTPAVAVGGPIFPFVLPDHTGRPFDLGTLRGKPFLLKFFRGHW